MNYMSTIFVSVNTRGMREIYLQFEGIPQIITVEVEPQCNAEFFWNNLSSMGRPADKISYNKSPKEKLDNFLKLAHEAKQLFSFDWTLSNLTQESFNLWHRDIERFDLSQHPPWSLYKGNLFIDLHDALHEVEPKNPYSKSQDRQTITVKWFSPSLPWPETPETKDVLAYGDIEVDYPHVGKSPWISMLHADNQNLQESCKLADACAPSFRINLVDYHKSLNGKNIDINQIRSNQHKQLLQWYQDNHDQLESMFSPEQMLKYHGHFCVGKVKDLSQLPLLQTAPLNTVKLV